MCKALVHNTCGGQRQWDLGFSAVAQVALYTKRTLLKMRHLKRGELLVRLPQLTGITWISRLEASTSLLCSITEVDAASIAIIVPADGECTTVPYASVVSNSGPYGALLQHVQQQGLKAAVAAAARNGGEPFTSSHVVRGCPNGEVVLLSAGTSSNGFGGSTFITAISAGGLGSSGYGIAGGSGGDGGAAADIPTDWAAVAASSPLRRFCGLPLRVGPQLIAVVTLAWAGDCLVPPGLRSCAAGGAGGGGGATAAGGYDRGAAAGGGVSGSMQRIPPSPTAAATPAAQHDQQRRQLPVAMAAPSGAERACLLQLAQVVSLGLFGDAASVVYGQKVARMIHSMTQAVTLQATLDGLLAGVRDILFHRCQHDLTATLALKHNVVPTAAFILEGRSPGSLSPPPPSAQLQPRGSTTTAQGTSTATAAPAAGQQRGLHPPAAAGGNNGGGGGGSQQRPAAGQPRSVAPAVTGAAASHPQPNRSHKLQGNALAASGGGGGGGPAAAVSPVAAGPAAAAISTPGNASLGGSSNAHNNHASVNAAAAASTSSNMNNNNNNNNSNVSINMNNNNISYNHARSSNLIANQSPSLNNANLSSGGVGPSGRISVSAHYHRLRSGEGGRGGAIGGSTIIAGNSAAGVMSGVLRHAMSVDLGGSTEGDCDTPSTVHAHITSLAHTLLMASLSMGPEAADDDPRVAGGGGGGGARHAQASGTQDRGDSSTGKRALGGYMSLQGKTNGVVGRAGPAVWEVWGKGERGRLERGLDESMPCRDLVLVQKLTRMPVQSLVLVVVRPTDVAAAAGCQGAPLPPCAFNSHYNSTTQTSTHIHTNTQTHHTTATASTTSTGMDSASHPAASLLAGSIPSMGLYLTSSEPLPRSALQGVLQEAREAIRLATEALHRHVTQGSLLDEWNGLLEAMATASCTGRMSYGSSRMVSLLRPRSSNMLHEQTSGELLPYAIMNSPSRIQLGTSPGELCSRYDTEFLICFTCLSATKSYFESSCILVSGVLSSELSKPLASGRFVVDASVEQPLQQLDAMVSSIQSTLSAVQLHLDVPGGGGDMQETRLNDIAAVELMEIIGRGGQGVVFRGMVHGIEAAIKVISHREDAEGAANAKSAAAAAAAAAGTPPRTLESPMVVDEARMRERKRNLLRDALELAVTTTISHPNIVQMYGYFTDCVVVQYANQANRLKLLPADSEALQQYGSQRGPVNTVMCMEFCDDLKPSNVLLKSSLRDTRGWICKLSDFGCVRVMNEEGDDGRLGFRQPQPLGTLTHMAPEMFVHAGLLDAGVDIYAFGIIMWELIMVAPLYDGTVPKEKLPSMIRRGLRPIFHPLVPPEYRMLATACWQDDPRRRPTAAVLVSMLQRLLVRAQATARSGSSYGSIGGHHAASKAMSSSFSGIGPAQAASPAAEPDACSAAGGGGAAPASAAAALPSRHVYGGVMRRNTVASSLGQAAASHGGGAAAAAAASGGSGAGGSGQRQAFPPPLPSPLSREAGPAARAAVRMGDGGGVKASARLAESPILSQPQAGSMNVTALSPLGTGLGPLASPPLASPPLAAASGDGAPLVGPAPASVTSRAVASGGVTDAAAAAAAATAGPLDDVAAAPTTTSTAAKRAVAAGTASAGSAISAAPFSLDAQASSLLGIGNTTAGDPHASSSTFAAANAARALVSGGGGAAATNANAAVVAPHSPAAFESPDALLPLRGSVFPTGSLGPLTASTANGGNTGDELVGL
ncbi:hypothetical protein VOLCADRAFT_104919 [Volvox carteri f. nagariensis]|uniref:Protein kinase domain-containing protein n=1 Tax=Volvox carteri f. nagariensis TaxID=3068 RepID=D8TX24_VOLCA|nr:uncharacterized protein VOLCADRAFT_104919 [Volvox carteri f. nagariensis]EFJ47836.1 hypothetical protein VOLCADRAFT_104919 [Volvox carteri f. nagariensis]|eukprot:XP_002950942.1 hypothetical protein VOLCADRAFT_104919 [Volvox carteri f. nagariensis]